MAIRFQCGSCNQPIEVDDPWGGRTVACPYCHSTVTAPSASTLGDISDIPAASPVTADASDSISAQPSESSNVVALIAFILAMIVIALIGLGTMIAAPHALNL